MLIFQQKLDLRPWLLVAKRLDLTSGSIASCIFVETVQSLVGVFFIHFQTVASVNLYLAILDPDLISLNISMEKVV